MTNEEQADTIRALLHEREGYVARGQADRVKLVDKELARLGHEAEKPSQRAQKRPSAKAKSKR